MEGHFRASPPGIDHELDFESFFREHHARLFQTLILVTGSRAEAEDLVQEALVRACERWERIRRMDSPAGYVYRTALNLNRKRLRRALRSRRRVHPATAADQASGVDPGLLVEARDQVRRALAALTEPQREALLLVEWAGMNAEEAGAALGIDGASVRGRVHRARIALREGFGGIDD